MEIMKRIFLNLWMLVCSMSMFMACSDNDEPNIPIEKELAGAYKGTLDITMDGSNLANGLPKNITITKAGVSTINLELKDFSFMGQNLGHIVIADCEMLKYRDRYTISGNQTLTLPSPIGGCTVVASGTLIGRDLMVDLDIAVATLGQTVKVTFAGTKLTGNESSEAKITSFTIDNEIVTELPMINEEAGKITFKVSDAATVEEIKNLRPIIVVSDKATLFPATAQDFNNDVVYTVVAEDGSVKTYTVSTGKNAVFSFDFEEWGTGDGMMYDDVPYTTGWASCNDAVGLIKNMGFLGGISYTGAYPVRFTADHIGGEKGAEMESVDTKGGTLLGQKVPKVTSGTLFLGSFDAMAAIVNPMATTSFGIMYDKKPLTVKGYFKYIQGKEFYNAEGALVENGKDECAISAVLYEVDNEKETLDGSTIYNSPKIVASAVFNNAGTAEFTPFELSLNYSKTYDSAKKYKFAVIFASSKDGAAYNAAVGSKLTIDDVVIVNE